MRRDRRSGFLRWLGFHPRRDVFERGGPYLVRGTEDLIPTGGLLDEYSPALFCTVRNSPTDGSGRRSLIVSFLEVLDNLDRAIEAAEKTTSASGLLEGVKMVSLQLTTYLDQHQCRRIPIRQ